MKIIMKSRNDLPNFKKLDFKVDTQKLLSCFSDDYNQDEISKTCGEPYLSNNYNQISVTTYSEMKYIRGKEDERCYGDLIPRYKGTYVEEVINMFKSPVTRVRLVVKEPEAFIKPHIDYDTLYSVRYYIPLQTNQWALTAVQKKGESPEVKHLCADGSIWFVNPGQLHSAWNFGSKDDIRLVLSVNGQKDLIDFYGD